MNKATVVPGTESACSSRQQEVPMEDEIKGKARELKGKAKDAMGGLTGNAEQQLEGKLEQAAGKTQQAFGKVERKLKEDEEDELKLDDK
jgi:uncharacterized protein YjbJ (UPF0337 family)